ncbi:MAG: hypothetical protein GY724_23105, partial [Actinomycetia bacterium]|nr:hypothetical protein [Actinomycetes bacterium]
MSESHQGAGLPRQASTARRVVEAHRQSRIGLTVALTFLAAAAIAAI